MFENVEQENSRRHPEGGAHLKMILNLGLGTLSLSCSQTENGFSCEVNSMKPSFTCSSDCGAARKSSHTDRLPDLRLGCHACKLKEAYSALLPLRAADYIAVLHLRPGN